MLSLRDPSAARLDAVLPEQAAQPFSYDSVGATRSEPPEGYRHSRRSGAQQGVRVPMNEDVSEVD